MKCEAGIIMEPWQQILQGVQELADHSHRPYARNRRGLYWDAPRKHKDSEEEIVCECLAQSLSDQKLGNLREIRKYHCPNNPDMDFPDCLADMDGKVIGIEVTQLRKKINSCDGQICYPEWTLEQFRKKIFEIVERKNKNAQKLGRRELLENLDQLYVVICTDELQPEYIRDYLKQPIGPKPCEIDKAFVLGPYEPADDKLIRGREYETMGQRVEHTAFQIRWESEV